MCGGDNLEIKTFNSTWIECKNKECRLESGFFDTVEIAIEKWNTRAENPPLKLDKQEQDFLLFDYHIWNHGWAGSKNDEQLSKSLLNQKLCYLLIPDSAKGGTCKWCEANRLHYS